MKTPQLVEYARSDQPPVPRRHAALGTPEFKLGVDETGAPSYGAMPVTARDVEESDDADEYGSSNSSGR